MINANPRPTIFGTGLIALDLVISADAETPVRAWTGGTCGNVLSILALLGWDAYPVARMNGDAASQRVRADFKKWGVQLRYASCQPTTNTPIIVQRISRKKDGSPTHRFSWSCPHCGSWLPSFKPVTADALEPVLNHLSSAKAFFMDRLSRSALLMAKRASDAGAVVMFEPSAKSDEKHLREALKIAHIVKYSDERFAKISNVMTEESATLIEVQTSGENGLRYRHRLRRVISDWKKLDAIAPDRVTDTCGSGDWCTSGLLAKLAINGLEGLRGTSLGGVVAALRFGQKLASWNLGFEGARGGMYAIDRGQLESYFKSLSSGDAELVQSVEGRASKRRAAIACPACPPSAKSAGVSRNTRAHLHSR